MDLADSARNRFLQQGESKDLETAIRLRKRLLAVVPPTHMFRAIAIDLLAVEINERFLRTNNPADLDEVIQLNREALASGPHDRSLSLQNLATSLHTRFEQKWDTGDIDEAIRLHRECLLLRRGSHANRDHTLSDLGDALEARFEQLGNYRELDEAILVYREALALRSPIHPERGRSLGKLGQAINLRYKQSPDSKAMEEAISLLRQARALHSPSHPDYGATLASLTTALETRFGQRGKLSDLNEAILLQEEVLRHRGPLHPGRSSALDGLAQSLQIRFQRKGNLEDIDNAITMYRQALALCRPPHGDRGARLNNLGTALQMRANVRTPNAAELDEVIQLHREALSLRPQHHPARGTSLTNLANAIHHRFKQQGNAKDIDENIELHREALGLYPPLRPGREVYLNNLAFGLAVRGTEEDITEAIHLLRGSLVLQPASYAFHITLSQALVSRFELRRNGVDLDEAVQLLERTLELVPSESPNDRSLALSNLAAAVSARFQNNPTQEEVDRVIKLHKEALFLRPSSHPEHGHSLANLAGSIYARFLLNGETEDIHEAIRLMEEALLYLPPSNPSRKTALASLALSRLIRFARADGPESDIHEAVKISREVLDLHPSPHPQRGKYLFQLGRCLVTLHDTGVDCLDEAMLSFQSAATYPFSSFRYRFHAARDWAYAAHRFHHSLALVAYQTAISLLPYIATLDLDLRTRQQMLFTEEANGLASKAAACAAEGGNYDLAVELLEGGRSVFWTQALLLRVPLDKIRELQPKLGEKLASLAKELEHGSFRHSTRNLSADAQQMVVSMEAEGTRLVRLHEEWNKTVESAKSLVPEFQEFMEPKRIEQLRCSAKHGPVVILNASETSCHALIVQSSGAIQSIPFPTLSLDFLKFLGELVHALSGHPAKFGSFLTSLHGRGDEHQHRLVGKIVYEKSRSPNEYFELLLRVLWSEIAKPVIQALRLEKSENPSRLWWCPTGPFVFLPIHAAGIYTPDNVLSVADYVISSYTPTVTALIAARDNPTTAMHAPKVTAIIQPTTPGHGHLPHTETELQKITETVPKEWLTSLNTSAALTSKSFDTVLSHLQTSSIVHFACHGVQDIANPLESGLLIGDKRLNVSQLIQTSGGIHDTLRPDVQARGLAFLSACQTAMGDSKLPDESMHLAATLLFGQFSSVVATMWTMYDPDGPDIVEVFYRYLFRNADPTSSPPHFADLSDSARALHMAVNQLRQKVPFARWVPFVHFGV
ncbi:CHAT domain-containing protein [Mycena pura]|uniref:CHAT domain-containing protein n=1 Tax=Mycena pura TaxID=153505 RepID=A0AAD6VD77_9AGAR|nr:CHAT domain-containing protein [Mycena pura]